MSKQNSPRWDAAFCGDTSGAILFANVPLKLRMPGLFGLKSGHAFECSPVLQVSQHLSIYSVECMKVSTGRKMQLEEI